MTRRNFTLASAGLALLLGSATTFASPVGLPDVAMKLYRDIIDKREPPTALGASATEE
jgi:hypothetical protein